MNIGDIFFQSTGFIHENIMALNSSKYFAGIVMIMLNIGSKFIQVKFSKSTEEYIKMSVTKQLVIFSMAWMGTRDIYIALVLTAVFIILSDYLFNEESPYCCVPEKYKVLSKVIDTNNDGVISEKEIQDAIGILNKAKEDKNRQQTRTQFTLYGNYMMDPTFLV